MRLLDPHLLRQTGDDWELLGQQCGHCGKIAFPRKRVCPVCFSSELDEYILSLTGTLHTYTTTHLGPPGLPAPYTIGFLDLPEGLKLMGLIKVDQPAEDHLEVGMAMTIIFEPLRQDPDGEDVYFYKFAPVGAEAAQ